MTVSSLIIGLIFNYLCFLLKCLHLSSCVECSCVVASSSGDGPLLLLLLLLLLWWCWDDCWTGVSCEWAVAVSTCSQWSEEHESSDHQWVTRVHTWYTWHAAHARLTSHEAPGGWLWSGHPLPYNMVSIQIVTSLQTMDCKNRISSSFLPWKWDI